MQDLLRGQDLPHRAAATDQRHFIPARVFDNPALLRVNPEYLAWLLSLPTLAGTSSTTAHQSRLKPAAGRIFQLPPSSRSPEC
jgi:hypothetical protein